MKKRLLSLIVCLVLVITSMPGCSKKAEETNQSSTEGTTSTPTASGEAAEEKKEEAVTYRTLYSSEVQTLNYLVTSTTNDFAVGANVIDTLVEYDSYGNIQPSLAESWTISDDGTVYTFKLREGQKWYDCNGTEVADVTAEDFVSSMKYILTSEYESSTAQNLFRIIKNAEEYYNGTMSADDPETEAVEGVPIDFSEVGIKALDTYTVEYTLENPVPYFLSSLTYVCYMPAYGPKLEELGSNFGAATDASTMLYCGAYILSEFWPQEKRVYTKNTNNWDADNVYITTIEQTYNAEASTLSPTMVERDEVDYASISSDILDEWLSDPTKSQMVSKGRMQVDYSYYFCFNFDPQFDAEYEPENWKLAVNNENFRQAMMAALDRKKAISVSEPETPDMLLQNTITPNTFVSLDGKDFTQFGELSSIMARDSFDENKALEYKEKAMEELAAEGCTFPVKVLMSYNPTSTDWASECVVIEQQMEGVLGTDFIDIIVEAGPSQNFLSEVRRSGKYAFMKCNWGADYQDPDTWAEPFRKENNSYNFMSTAIDEGSASADTISEYYDLVAKAKEYTTDMTARYEAYAAAEAYLIEHALVVPYSVDTLDYCVTKLNTFEGQYAPFGVSNYRYKGMKLQDTPISMEEFEANYEAWKANVE